METDPNWTHLSRGDRILRGNENGPVPVSLGTLCGKRGPITASRAAFYFSRPCPACAAVLATQDSGESKAARAQARKG